MKCQYFVRKTGGYRYGWKCKAHLDGNFPLLTVDGERIHFFEERSVGFDKEVRDQYVKEKCLGDCKSCSLYQSNTKRSESNGHHSR